MREPYQSPHGIEQDRRDFLLDNPDLYRYITFRAAEKALDSAGDTISGHHAAANQVWAQAAAFRAKYEEMQKRPKGSESPGQAFRDDFIDATDTGD